MDQEDQDNDVLVSMMVDPLPNMPFNVSPRTIGMGAFAL
jgi:hypothetical protein